jgi:inhibitor of KinA sporulation pathway (predicted exonuclease)
MASATLEKILVIDLEATCDEPKPAPFKSEIIEIGVAVVDVRKLEVVDKDTTFVRPVNSWVTPFCTQLTTITAEDLKASNGARTFPEAMNWIQKRFGTKNKVWGSWGDYDRNMLVEQCRDNKVDYPFGTGHMNIKTMMALFEGLNRGIGAKEAVEFYHLQWQGTHHRGMWDAVNIGQVLVELLRRYKS